MLDIDISGRIYIITIDPYVTLPHYPHSTSQAGAGSKQIPGTNVEALATYYAQNDAGMISRSLVTYIMPGSRPTI